jgi:hypothetical protein
MKHLQKFNEAKKNKEVDPIEKLDTIFFEFIEELVEAGDIARSESASSDYSSDDKKEVDVVIKDYGDLLSKLNNKFEKFKSSIDDHYKKNKK